MMKKKSFQTAIILLQADRSTSSSCLECPIGKYKPEQGSAQCRVCPLHSKASFRGSVECRCSSGYYRSHNDQQGSACTRPPTTPRNVTATKVSPDTVNLSWSPPRDEGGRTDTVYKLVCPTCGPEVRFSPDSPTFSQTFVSVSSLSPTTNYKFQVIAENGVSSESKEPPQVAEIFITTEQDNPSTVPLIYVKKVEPNSIEVAWRPPSDHFSEIEMYEVQYFVRGSTQSSSPKTQITKNEELVVTGLAEKTEYGFQVRAKRVSGGWGDFTPPTYRMTPAQLEVKPLPGHSVPSTPTIVGAVVAVIVLVLLIAVVVTLYLRRGSDGWSEKQQVGDFDNQEYRGVSPHYTAESGAGIVHTHTGGTMPLFNTFATHKTYIDPHTYEDPHQAIRQFAKELDPRYITIEAIIGGGEFGDVCRGRLSQPERQDMLVAIKTLKPGSSDKARSDFLTEASIMGQFEHPNVIFLQGVVTKATPVMIITEYMENGSLDTFLRANDGKFQVMQLVGMMRGIAYGMQYLAEMNYVHRDLAARNVLVNSQLVCKIADFGLSREISESSIDGAYTTRGGKIPVRWTAPEAIAFRKFTSSSDAWSFGIVMWEVMSYGERPYWNWSNQDVIKAIEKVVSTNPNTQVLHCNFIFAGLPPACSHGLSRSNPPADA